VAWRVGCTDDVLPRFVVTGLLMHRATTARLRLFYGAHAIATGAATCLAGEPAPMTSAVALPAEVMAGALAAPIAMQTRDAWGNPVVCTATLIARMRVLASNAFNDTAPGVTLCARALRTTYACTVASAFDVRIAFNVDSLLCPLRCRLNVTVTTATASRNYGADDAGDEGNSDNNDGAIVLKTTDVTVMPSLHALFNAANSFWWLLQQIAWLAHTLPRHTSTLSAEPPYLTANAAQAARLTTTPMPPRALNAWSA